MDWMVSERSLLPTLRTIVSLSASRSEFGVVVRLKGNFFFSGSEFGEAGFGCFSSPIVFRKSAETSMPCRNLNLLTIKGRGK